MQTSVPSFDCKDFKGTLGTLVIPLTKYTDGEITEHTDQKGGTSLLFDSNPFESVGNPIHLAAAIAFQGQTMLRVEKRAVIRWKVSGSTFVDRNQAISAMTGDGKLRGRVSDLQGDPRLCHGFVGVCDPKTGLWIGFTITKSIIHAVYGIKEPSELPTITLPRRGSTPETRPAFPEFENHFTPSIWKLLRTYEMWEIHAKTSPGIFWSLQAYSVWESELKQYNEDELAKEYTSAMEGSEFKDSLKKLWARWIQWCQSLSPDVTFNKKQYLWDPLYRYQKIHMQLQEYLNMYGSTLSVSSTTTGHDQYAAWRKVLTYNDYLTYITHASSLKNSEPTSRVDFKLGDVDEVNPKPARFTSIREVGRRDVKRPVAEYVKLGVSIDSVFGCATWYINSQEVWKQVDLGRRTCIWDRVVEHGGVTQHLHPSYVTVVIGTGEAFDWACPEPEYRKLASRGHDDLSHIAKYRVSNPYFATRPSPLGEIVGGSEEMFAYKDAEVPRLNQGAVLRLLEVSYQTGRRGLSRDSSEPSTPYTTNSRYE